MRIRTYARWLVVLVCCGLAAPAAAQTPPHSIYLPVIGQQLAYQAPAHAAMPAATQETMTFYAVADTFVRSWEPNANYGGRAELRLSYLSYAPPTDPAEEFALVRFDLSGLPSGAVIDTATMELYLTGAVGTTPKDILIHSVTSPWSEATVTGNNLPTALWDEMFSLGASVDSVTGQYKSWWILPTWAQYWLTHPDLNYGVILRRSVSKIDFYLRNFESREGANKPRLVITYHFCYGLTLTHTGSGSDPVATPTSSNGCPTGQYVAGEVITLNASPAAGWTVASWSGTNNNGSTSATNTVTMPVANHTTGVNYTRAGQDVNLLIELPTTADTHVEEAAPEASFFEEMFLAVGVRDPVRAEAWLLFDLSAIPSGAVVTEAMLRATAQTGGAGEVGVAVISPAQEAWREEELAWNTRPPVGAGLRRGVQELDEGALGWDITTLVQEWLDGEKENYGLSLANVPGTNWLRYLDSRETGAPPILAIRYRLPGPVFVWEGAVQTEAMAGGSLEPVFGATVRVYGSAVAGQLGQKMAETATGVDGHFLFAYRPAAQDTSTYYRLQVSGQGLNVTAGQTGPAGEAMPDGSIRYSGIPGGHYAGSVFAVAPTTPLADYTRVFAGQVLDEAGAPVSHVEVVLYGAANVQEPQAVLAGAGTDGQGAFRLPLMLKPEQDFPLYVLQVADPHVAVTAVQAGAGGRTAVGQRIVFEATPAGDYRGNRFTVAALQAATTDAPDAEAQAGKKRPLLAVLITPNCTCAPAKCTIITNPNVLGALDDSLFSTSGDSVNGFFLENSQTAFGLSSAGVFQVTPADLPTTPSLDESSNCVHHDYPGGVEHQRAYVVRDVLAGQLGFNFAQYDGDQDGVVEARELMVLLVYTDPGLDNARVRRSEPPRVTVGSVDVELSYALIQAHHDLYTIAHELSHLLPYAQRDGKPLDQYHGLGRTGRYSVMDDHCHPVYAAGIGPNTPLTGTQRIDNGRFPHLDPWNKIQLGWLQPVPVADSGWVTLGAIEQFGDVLQIQAPGRPQEYFLIENRWPPASTYETQLTGSGGLAIWHIDEGLLPDQGRVVALDRASGYWLAPPAGFCADDFDVDALWDGRNSFSPVSTPDSGWHTNKPSNVTITCITPGATAKAYVDFSGDALLSEDMYEPNNTHATATALAPGQPLNATITAACDHDFYGFDLTDYTSLTLKVSAAYDGQFERPAPAPQLTLRRAASPIAVQAGTLVVARALPGDYTVEIAPGGPIYYRLDLALHAAEMAPDRYDDGLYADGTSGEPRNDRWQDATPLALAQHIPERIELPGMVEIGGSGGGRSEADLNFDVAADRDFFRFQIDPSFQYAPELGQECPPGPAPVPTGYELVTHEKARLRVRLSPELDLPFDVHIYTSGGKEVKPGPAVNVWAWGAEIECPLSLFADGIVIMAVQDHAGQRNVYNLSADYRESHIVARDRQIFDFIPVVDLSDVEFVLPLDPGPLHRVFPDDPVAVSRCLSGHCPQDLPASHTAFVWPQRQNFALEIRFPSGGDLGITLLTADGEPVGTAVPTGRAGGATVQGAATAAPAAKLLVQADLAAGLYLLEFDGETFGTEYELRFGVGFQLYLPSVSTSGPSTAGPALWPADRDRRLYLPIVR